MMLSKLFKKKEEEKPEEKPNRCRLCGLVASAGRSGEKFVKFADGDSVKVEIVNESGIPGRLCYTLNLMDDAELGWVTMPIRYCPLCGKSLRRREKK